jgi:2-furoyl-CoA dehydrogenase large subunit
MLMEGSFAIAAPIDRVWAAFFDVPTMMQWVPGVVAARQVDERHYEITLEQRVAFLTARFDARLQLQEVRPPESVSFVLEGKDGRIASSIKVGTTISLRDTWTGQTEVTYRNDMGVFGRLGAIGFAAIKRKVQDVEAEFARRANAALSGVPGESRATV